MKTLDLIRHASEEVMKSLGPTYIEGVYEEAILHEFRLREIPYERQRNVEIFYKGYSIGYRTPDCILYPTWSGTRKKEYLLEMKAINKIQEKNIKQAQVYLSSLNMNKGAVLNFNKKTNEVDIEEVEKSARTYTSEIKKPSRKKSKANIKNLLLKAGKEVLNYLGTEFFYYDAGIYFQAVGVEMRLKGVDFHSATYPLLYKGHRICDYVYNYIFPTGEAAIITSYKNEEDIKPKVEELKTYNQIFGIKKGYVSALPESYEDKVIIFEFCE